MRERWFAYREKGRAEAFAKGVNGTLETLSDKGGYMVYYK